ncbi:brain-specific angiogenesis inhibitor 1-associated protein 2-like protein 1 [Argiope bruennichi]|uniref:brain-specific angiogenesis inhibitor 1-associated protein 2-like protein 1 n=1 Tax=Argiope bruennichi TaxID=94029 RepID=UPI002493D33A|nr:brain-specific angiogenesis inhibitor 1-associated protein 2-like protein 1 [Argiope bruennichi]
MDSSESTAKLVDTTYKNIIEEFGPCTKQLVTAGRTYLKSLNAMVAASRQYTDALAKIASLANNSTLSGSRDIGSTLYSIVDVNKEILAQQSNIIKSLEFDFLEPMEIAAEKDTKLVGREQKRFQQLYKGRREAYLKCISTLKKTRRKKNMNTDKQLANMKMLESAKERLEVFCNDSLKEAIIQERVMYGTVLERQCALNRQFLIYHNKGCEILEERLPQWEGIAETRDKLPDTIASPVKNGHQSFNNGMESIYALDSMLESVIRSNSIARSYGKDRDSYLSQTLRLNHDDNIYARPIVRAKSEYCLPTSTPSESPKSDGTSKRYSRIMEYNGDGETSYAKVLYAYQPTGDHQLALREGDVVEYITEENTTGWQFGDNLTSGKSGWFPVSYTEPIKDPAKYLYNEDYMDVKPPPPPPLPPVPKGSVRSKYSNPEHDQSEYATLTRGKKLLPVTPPTIPSAFDGNMPVENGGTLKAKHYASHPNIFESTSDTLGRNNGRAYHNGQYLPSMRL